MQTDSRVTLSNLPPGIYTSCDPLLECIQDLLLAFNQQKMVRVIGCHSWDYATLCKTLGPSLVVQ